MELLLGLRYHEVTSDRGAQTERRGLAMAGEDVASRQSRTGRFL